jgi:hypothetical protein
MFTLCLDPRGQGCRTPNGRNAAVMTRDGLTAEIYAWVGKGNESVVSDLAEAVGSARRL